MKPIEKIMAEVASMGIHIYLLDLSCRGHGVDHKSMMWKESLLREFKRLRTDAQVALGATTKDQPKVKAALDAIAKDVSTDKAKRGAATSSASAKPSAKRSKTRACHENSKTKVEDDDSGE